MPSGAAPATGLKLALRLKFADGPVAAHARLHARQSSVRRIKINPSKRE
jgi:hypothetical protein